MTADEFVRNLAQVGLGRTSAKLAEDLELL